MRACHCATSMHVDRLPVMASDLVNVASASHCRFSQLSRTYREQGIENRKIKNKKEQKETQEAEQQTKRRENGNVKKDEAEEGDLYRTGNIWRRRNRKKEKKTYKEKESSSFFVVLEG